MYTKGVKSMERTLVIIKPDATKRQLEDKIISMYAMNGLNIIHHSKVRAPLHLLEKHYDHLKSKEFYPSLLRFMSSSDIIVLILEGQGVIEQVRKIHGPTNPDKAEEGTVRKLYGTNSQENAVHASDSVESAEREIAIWKELIQFN